MGAAAQRQNVDSLINILETKKLTNKEKIDLYGKICNGYLFNDADKLILYAEIGQQIAKKESDKGKECQFYRLIASGYHNKGEYDTAMAYFEKSLELAIETKDKEMEAIIYGSIANMYNFQEKKHVALEYYLNALSIFEVLGNKKSCALALFNIGSLHWALQNTQQAMSYVERAKQIAEEINDNYIMMLVCYLLADFHSIKNEYDQSLEYNAKALDISRTIGDKQGEVLNLQSLAHGYCEGKKEYDIAEKYALECLQIAEEFGEPRLSITARGILSTVYLHQKRYRECESLLFKVLERDSIVLKDLQPETKTVLHNLIISQIYLGNTEKAVHFLKELMRKMEQYTDENYLKSFSDMEVKYETEKKELRIASLEKERRLYIWLGIAGVLFAVFLGITLWLRIKNARKEKQLIATRSVLDGEMKERARLAQDLHDRLSGNLSAVKIELSKYAETLQNVRDKLDNCIKDIRDAAHNLMPTSLQFGMKTALEDFAAQFPNVKFHFFGEEKRIDGRTEFVIYCCANELINNSVKHSDAKNINLQLVQTEKHVSLTVSDDGCGFDEKTVTKGFGLKSIRDRIASCNGKIDISTQPGKGTETTIELKIET
jgi:signal transduction histidine kinase